MDEMVFYLEAANGQVMRVPESKLEAFEKMNEKIKTEQKQNAEAQQGNIADNSKATQEELREAADETVI